MKIKDDDENNEFFNDNFTGIAEFCDGARELHSIHYCKNGKYHREDGPARCWYDGTKQWLLNGLTHRTDGPAIEYPNGAKFWYLNGRCFDTEKEWKIEVKKLLKSKLVAIK
jgi:hypothetical protein